SNESPTRTIFIWFPNTSGNVVVPAKYLFRPELKRVKHLNVGTISKGHFVFAKRNKTLDCIVIAPYTRVSNKRINTIHLHCYFFVYRDFATHDCLSEASIILWSGGVCKRHLYYSVAKFSNPLSIRISLTRSFKRRGTSSKVFLLSIICCAQSIAIINLTSYFIRIRY